MVTFVLLVHCKLRYAKQVPPRRVHASSRGELKKNFQIFSSIWKGEIVKIIIFKAKKKKKQFKAASRPFRGPQ